MTSIPRVILLVGHRYLDKDMTCVVLRFDQGYQRILRKPSAQSRDPVCTIRHVND